MNSCHLTSQALRAGALAVLSVFPLAAWAGVAGQFQFVSGDVRILGSDGRERPAQKGQDISEGETVVTATGASAQLKMIDGGILALRPDSQLKMSAYVFKGREDGSEKANMSLVKGGLRAISGLIGKTNKQNYAITTPTATIGIRGTDHEPVVILPPPPGQQAPHPPGTYNKVNVGATTLTTLAGTAVISPNQVGFAPAPNVAPLILPRIPDFFRATPLPTQARPAAAPAGSQSNSNSQGANAATTSARSGDAAGDAMRIDSSADTASAPAPSPAASSTVIAAQVSNSNAPTAAETKKTGVDASGNKVDATDQKVTRPDGSEIPATRSALEAVTDPHGNMKPLPAQVLAGQGTVDIVLPSSYITSVPISYFFRESGSQFYTDGRLASVSYGFRYGSTDVGILTLAAQPDVTTADFAAHTATGLSWGRWAGGHLQSSWQYLGQDAANQWGYGSWDENEQFVIGRRETSTSATPAGGLHWIAGAQPAPDYLPRILTGTASYSLVGGTRPTDGAGTPGLLRNATLNVDFTQQLANAFVDLSMGGTDWSLESHNMVLQGSRFASTETRCAGDGACGFRAYTGSGATRSAAYGSGYISGSLAGATLNGAALQYQYGDAYPTIASDSSSSTSSYGNSFGGVAALSGGPSNPLSQVWRATGITMGWGGGEGYADGYLHSYNDKVREVVDYRGTVEGGEGPLARIVNDGDGKLTEFVGRASMVDGVMVDAVVKAGTGVNNIDFGSTSMGGVNVSWGRWENGNINVFDRDGGLIGAINNDGRSLHWMATGNLTGPITTLPATGEVTYSLAGSTAPTDMNGRVGSLGAAHLSANFGQMKVNADVTVNFGSGAGNTTLSTSAAGIPLLASGSFSSNTLTPGLPGGAATHTASCSGSLCGNVTAQAYINGQFVGSNAAGAGLAYGIVSTPSAVSASGIAVTGVAVFKR